MAGPPYAVQNLFVPWNADEGHMDWLFERILPRIRNAGRVPLITPEPDTPGAATASVDTQAVVENQEYETYIDRWADRLSGFLAGTDGTAGTADEAVVVDFEGENDGAALA